MAAKIGVLVFCGLVAQASGLAARPCRVGLSRRDASRVVGLGAAAIAVFPEASHAGASTDLKTDRTVAANKYGPRVRAGRDFFAKELPSLISAGSWQTIGSAISIEIDPADKKQKRKKVGALASMVSAMGLWASSFSRGAQRSAETTAMLAAVEEFKAAVTLLETATSEQVKDDGFFSFLGGTRAPSAAEREKAARKGLADGSKALNAYFAVVNPFLKASEAEPIPSV